MATTNNGIRINHGENGTIIITKVFEKLSRNTNSAEYRQLAKLHKDYPTYIIQTRTAAKNANKNTHKGLTLTYIEKFLEMQENAADVLEAFERVKYLNEKHPAYYAIIKKWFLAKYPDYENFSLDKPAPAPSQIVETTPHNVAA